MSTELSENRPDSSLRVIEDLMFWNINHSTGKQWLPDEILQYFCSMKNIIFHIITFNSHSHFLKEKETNIIKK